MLSPTETPLCVGNVRLCFETPAFLCSSKTARHEIVPSAKGIGEEERPRRSHRPFPPPPPPLPKWVWNLLDLQSSGGKGPWEGRGGDRSVRGRGKRTNSCFPFFFFFPLVVAAFEGLKRRDWERGEDGARKAVPKTSFPPFLRRRRRGRDGRSPSGPSVPSPSSACHSSGERAML